MGGRDTAAERAATADWHSPGSYSVWAYYRGERDDDEPLFFVAYEWEYAGLRGVRAENVWFHEDYVGAEKDPRQYPDYEEIGGGIDAGLMAQLIQSGKVHRIGVLPQIGRYTGPPNFHM